MGEDREKNYCLVQSNLDPIDPAVLKVAFRAVGELVDNDARILSADAFGILVEGLGAQTARILANELAKAGISMDIVHEWDIPTLPDPHTMRRGGCAPEVFIATDSLGRDVPVDWSKVLMVAAGMVPLREAKRVVRTRYRMLAAGTGGMGSMPAIVVIPEHDVTIRYKRESYGLIDIFVEVEPYRYRIRGNKFNFSYLGERMRKRKIENFCLFVGELATYAGAAALNRGAVAIREEGLDATFGYPSRHAFEEETVWLLYRLGLSRGRAWPWMRD